jgi:two-component system OmpR family response regulator
MNTLTNRKRRVLVADDDPMIRQLVSNLIEKEGCKSVLLADGGSAYRLLQSDADFCGAVFDVRMPQIEGLDLLRFMQTEKRLMRIPVLMITSELDLKTMASSFAAGAALFLAKPFTSEQFQSTFRLLLNSHLAAMHSTTPQRSPMNLPGR